MLQPKRTKYRKAHKGRIHGFAKGGRPPELRRLRAEGDSPGRVSARQIEAARRAITRHMKPRRQAVDPDLSRMCRCPQKPAEVRQGKGKGSPEWWAARVKPGRIMFELDGVPRGGRAGLHELAAAKLPIGTRFVSRLGEE